MVRSTVNEKFDFFIDENEGQLTINGDYCELDIAKIDNTTLHILYKNKPYRVSLVSRHEGQKKFEIKVNRNHYVVRIADEGGLLMEKAGIPTEKVRRPETLKAPMPGLITDIKVRVGDQVKTGDPLAVLKAMKMENVLKSPRDGVIREIFVEKNEKIEKDSLILQF